MHSLGKRFGKSDSSEGEQEEKTTGERHGALLFSQIAGRRSDEEIVTRNASREPFMSHAEEIFDVAQAAYASGEPVTDVSILIGYDGTIRMVADSDWPLDTLSREHGARMAYRVSQGSDRLRVEGRAGLRTCLFEAVKPDGAARLLLDNRRQYGVLEARALLA
ncbi:MAG: hypothetical protein IT168_30940 [Bryobacterales bacterium]|nr:hypothetical protein [Bryobacterales bacterium]